MNKEKTIKVSKDRAIIIASNHNNIPIEKAKEYTDSELREVLRHLNLKTRILIPKPNPKQRKIPNINTILNIYIHI